MLIETITPRADTPDETYAQTTMRVTQAQRLDRAGRRQQDRARGEPLLRRAGRRRRDARRDQDDQRPLRRRDHARARPALDPDRRRRSSSRSRSTRKLAARLLATYIDKEVRDQEIHAFSQSIAAGAPARASSTSGSLTFVDDQRAQAQRRDRRRARPRVRVLRPAHGLRPLPAQAPADAPGHRDAAAVLPAHRLRARRDGRRGARALPAVLVARVPAELADAVQRGHARTSSSRAASCSTRPTITSRHLPALHRRRAALEVLGRHRPRVPPRALARLADREHQRPLQRHRAVAEDARRVGRGGEPGRQAQGRLLRVPRAVARRHRGVPRAARQHRRRGAAARTT